MTRELLEQNIDLPFLEQQIQILRLKLGSALDYLDAARPEIAAIEELHDCMLAIQAEIDGLIEKIQLLPD